MAKILIVDDDPNIRALMKLYLLRDSFTIFEVSNGLEALDVLADTHVDLVILDVMMPGMDGWELCGELQTVRNIPVLMVTARGEVHDKVKGFGLGADDYLVKPFEPVEMVMRVKALLKRYRISTSQSIQMGDTQINRLSLEVRVGDGSITLPPKELDVLFKLASYPGQIFTRGQLIEQIWGVDYDGDERTVDVHIKRLRERLEEKVTSFRIATVRGLGYRLEVIPD